MSPQYVWLAWSAAFLVPWIMLFLLLPSYRRVMWRASALTTPFGLTEPLFVPEYWNPPSLFDLAQSTGFDLESLIFCFGIGGVGAVLYNGITGRMLVPLPHDARAHARHRWHRVALLAPVLVSPALFLAPWNPIYAGIAAMVAGATAAVACRPDLFRKTVIGGGLFLAYYAVFMLALRWSAPGYIERVWNLESLSGLSIAGIPVEELLFGGTFGMYWTGVYEHVAWASTGRRRPALTGGLGRTETS